MLASVKKIKVLLFRKAIAILTKIYIRLMNIYIKTKAKA
jgi:hypothetical protein